MDTSREKTHDPTSRDEEWDASIPKKGYTKAPSEDWRAARSNIYIQACVEGFLKEAYLLEGKGDF